MEKQLLLGEIKDAAARKEITKEEVLQAYASGMGEVAEVESRHISLAQVLYYIGGTIVFLGISVLISQNWSSFDTVTKILVTLGVGIATYVVGVLLNRYEQYKGVALAFFLISALVNPIGLYVLFDQIGWDTSSHSVNVAIYLLLFALYYCSFIFYRKTIFALFSIVFATASFFSIIFWIIGNNLAAPDTTTVVKYLFLVTGLVYMLLGYYLRTTLQKALTGPLFAFGSLAFLGAAIFLGGWQPNQNAFWELIYPLLVFGIIFISVYVKSKALLVFGSIFLISYILKLTGEYFSTGLGWPLALVLAGLLIMVVGYYAVKINKKYLTTLTIK